MLRFELHQLDLRDEKVVPLPKLIPEQLDILASRFRDLGFKVTLGRRISARRGGQKLVVSPVGFCLSNEDALDIIAPAIPEILAVRKKQLDVSSILGEYFQALPLDGNVTVRLNTRLETGRTWHILRGTNQSGLTPDELLMVKRLLEGAAGKLVALTDFPKSGSLRRIVGKRQFYESSLTPSDLVSTIRPLGKGGEHNSYLPRKDTLVFKSLRPTPLKEWKKTLGELGEWCYLEPAHRERSN